MLAKSPIRRIAILYSLLLFASFVWLSWYYLTSLKDSLYDQTRSRLTTIASLATSQFSQELLIKNPASLGSLCRQIATTANVRITLIAESGSVVCDSQGDLDKMDNHAGRPEVAQALRGAIGTSTRTSHTVNNELYYVALPIYYQGQIIGVLRSAVPLSEIEQPLFENYGWIVIIGCLVIAIGLFAASLASNAWIKAVKGVKDGLQKFKQGDYSYKIYPSNSFHLHDLTDDLHDLGSAIQQRIDDLVQQRGELEAVLSSMIEGIMALDMDERIMRVNGAACKLLGLNSTNAQGKTVQEALTNFELQKFVKAVFHTKTSHQDNLVLRGVDGERHVHAYGRLLLGNAGLPIGTLIVLNDITQLRRLEGIRRDFVANVSHEFKTPVTSIKGFVETLLDGALDNPNDARRFLRIIGEQADRLNAIFEDLLNLSRIEDETEKNEIHLEPCNLRAIIERAVQICGSKSQIKNQTLNLQCSRDVTALANTTLLEQALVNLIDNAIKYSETDQRIDILVSVDGGNARIAVKDYGCGIDKQHLQRIFERFYRVDRARSRKLGGTGLGLAIVKHIANAHGGFASVESMPGKGSTFSITLLLAASAGIKARDPVVHLPRQNIVQKDIG